jgi:dihydropteroate synthase
VPYYDDVNGEILAEALVALAVWSAAFGVYVVRVHDVSPMVRALRALWAGLGP